MPKHYLIRYAFEWGNGFRHGVMIPRGVYLGSGKVANRHWWTFPEARKITERLNALYGETSHWIIREQDASKP